MLLGDDDYLEPWYIRECLNRINVNPNLGCLIANYIDCMMWLFLCFYFTWLSVKFIDFFVWYIKSKKCIVNGEKMEKGFDFNSIDPKTIEKVEVIKKETALEKYGEQNVISVTVDASRKQSDKKHKNRITAVGTKAMPE